MRQVFDAARRCRNLREFVTPRAANLSLRAKHTLTLPAIDPEIRLVVDFDHLFRGELIFRSWVLIASVRRARAQDSAAASAV